MMNSAIMYLVQSEAEIPIQPLPNTAYYIIGKEVRIFDNAGKLAVFISPQKEPTPEQNEVISRIDKCEKRISKIFQYLTSFGGEKDE